VGGRRKGKGKVERWEDRRNWKGNVGGKKEMGKERGSIEEREREREREERERGRIERGKVNEDRGKGKGS